MLVFLALVISIIFSNLTSANPTLGLPPLVIPKDNQQTAGKIELGRQLFNDVRFSSNNTISCASCHQSDKAFTDGLKLPEGVNNFTGPRNSPTLVNAAFYQTFFLDGRESSLEAQSLGPFLNAVEHGMQNFNKVLSVIRSNPYYLQQFSQVFAVTAEQITIQHVAKAIASFERTLIAGNSLFDQYYFGRDHSKLSESAARGLRLFRRKGNCANCHEISFNNALFMDNRFYNIGVGFQRIKPLVDSIDAALNKGRKIEALGLTPEQTSELGRFKVTGRLNDLGKFKTPTVRNISLTAPYMHDGSMKTLEEVVEYYDKGGETNRFIDAAIFPLHLTKQEKTDLVNFMKSLNSPNIGSKQ